VQLTQGLDYTITGAGSSSPGSVTLVSALTSAQMLVLRRFTAHTQTLDLVFGGNLSLENLESSLDKITRQLQDVQDQINRTPRFDLTETTSFTQNLSIAKAVPGAALIWDSTGTTISSGSVQHSFLTGSGAPSPSLGSDGDTYLDTT